MAKLLTIVVTYNAMQWAKRCFDSIVSSSMHSDIFVVDNGSTDGTAEFIANYYPEAILYRSPKNLMFGKGNNVGLEYALNNGYDYVYLLNQDAWVMPDTFEILVDVSSRHDEFGIISPIQMKPDERNYEYIFNRLVISQLPVNLSAEDVHPVTFVQAANWLVSRKCLEKVGGFSPSFPHYGEDNNYCDRALYHSFKIGVAPAAKAVHDASNKPLTTDRQKTYRHYITFVITLSKITDRSSTISRLWFLLRRAKGLSVEGNSITPLVAFLKVLCNISVLLKNNAVSRGTECPFLKIECNK